MTTHSLMRSVRSGSTTRTIGFVGQGGIGEEMIDAGAEREDRLKVGKILERARRMAPAQRVADARAVERLVQRRDGVGRQQRCEPPPPGRRVPAGYGEQKAHGPPAMRSITGSASRKRRLGEAIGGAQTLARRPRPRSALRACTRASGASGADLGADRGELGQADRGVDRIGGARPAAAKLDDRKPDRAHVDRRRRSRRASGIASTRIGARGSRRMRARSMKSFGPPSAA